VLGIFPEGRVVREGEREELRKGAALLSVRTGAPVLPLVIRGSAAAWPPGRSYPGPGRVRVVVGPPLSAPAGPREEAEKALMEQIETALPRDDTAPAGEAAR
jgi:1-acyl-sn-glycerol-3-phosphate acyltransferase